MRIKLFDMAMTATTHVAFNSAFIRVIKLIYPNANIILYGERKNVLACQDVGITAKPFLFFPKKMSIYTLVPRDILASLYTLKYIFDIKKNEKIFFLMVLPFTHWVIYLINKFRKLDITICLHGNVEAYVNNSSLRKSKYYFNIERPIFKNKDIKYIILGKPIYENIKHIFSGKSKTIVIDHPYTYDASNSKSTLKLFPLIIGQIGIGDKNKGTPFMFKLAELLKEEIDAGKVKIKLIGRLSPNLIYLDNGLVEYQTTMLNKEDFKEGVESLHYTLQLRDQNTGKAIASGSFFDTIKYEKPYLSLDGGFVSYYADRYKNSGFIFNSIEKMAEKIKEMCLYKERFISDYNQSVSVIKFMQQELSLESIAINLKEQL